MTTTGNCLIHSARSQILSKMEVGYYERMTSVSACYTYFFTEPISMSLIDRYQNEAALFISGSR